MKICLPSATIDNVCGPCKETTPAALIHALANNGRTCTGVSDPDDYEKDCKMVAGLLEKKHGAALEFIDFHMTFIVSRDIEMELVRHRMASWLWSSTRYINYTKKFGIEYVLPTKYLEASLHSPAIIADITDVHTEVWSLDKPADTIYPHNEICSPQNTIWKIPDPNSKNPVYISDDLSRWISSKLGCEYDYIDAIESGEKPETARSYLSGDLKAVGKCKMNFRELLHFLNLRTDSHAHPDMRYVACMIGREFNEMFKDIPYEFEHTKNLS